MGVEPSKVFRPKVRDEGLVVERIGDELLVYDRERDRAHRLNDTAALVFSRCDGNRSVSGLASQLSADAGAPVNEAVVARALVRLGDEHLLEEPVTPVAVGGDLSRRQILVRFGVAGAAAGAGLPVIKSIVAPTPAQAQASCVAAGFPCGVSTGTGCQQTAPCCTGSCQPFGMSEGPCRCS